MSFGLVLQVHTPKGPVNIYKNLGLGNLQRDHRLFLSFRHTGPPFLLNVEHAGPLVISMQDLNGGKDRDFTGAIDNF